MPEPTTIESTPSAPEGSGSLDRLVRCLREVQAEWEGNSKGRGGWCCVSAERATYGDCARVIGDILDGLEKPIHPADDPNHVHPHDCGYTVTGHIHNCDCEWRAHDNTGMRHLEQSDTTGGETDSPNGGGQPPAARKET